MNATFADYVADPHKTAQPRQSFNPCSHLRLLPDALRGCSPQDLVAGPEPDLSDAARPTTDHRDLAAVNGNPSARGSIGQTVLGRDFPWTFAENAPARGHSAPDPDAKGDRELLEALVRSDIFADYERAFTEVTGLPLALRSIHSWQLPHHGKRNEGPFCALMAEKGPSCGACLEVQAKLAEAAVQGAHTTVCPVGLSETAVPVRLGSRLIGFLQTGQVFRSKPTERQFQGIVKLLVEWGLDADSHKLRKAYFGTRVVAWRQQALVVKMLGIFADHLAMLSNEILIQRNHAESPLIHKAKAFIRDHHSERLRLPQVAKCLNLSPFHFCKLFKEGTGLTFTAFLSRIRIERSKNLLANPNLRVGEVGYEVGFQSLTHFNRVFHKILGQSPTEYRMRLRGEQNETDLNPASKQPPCLSPSF